MDHTEPTIKRPRVSIIPHTYEDGPALQVGNFRYDYDKGAALYHIRVLVDWIYREVKRDPSEGHAFNGDE